MTEQEMREVFREMRDEPVPADSLARVRGGMEQRIGKRTWWKFAVPLALAGCAVTGFLLLRPAKAPVVIEPPNAPVIAQVLPPPEPVVRNTARPKRAGPRPQRVAGVPVSIRIETPDPDVVILLVN
jgi:hypothetical protein